MKIQAIDLRETRRVDLGEDAPLPAPLSLYVEPTSLCNMRCQFCPTGDATLRQRRPNGTMDLELVRKLVADLKDWGVRLHRINLYKDGDPLVHPAFVDMVRILKEGDVSASLWTKTNGLKLEPAYNAQLVASGLDMIGVSVNAVDAKGYLSITQTKVDYARLVDGVRDLCARAEGTALKIYVKIANSGFTPEELAKFHEDFAFAPNVGVEQLHGWSASGTKDWTLGTNPTTFEGWPLVDKVACPLPFFMLAVNWNGTVSLCNEDWLHATLCGDLNHETIRQVWESERLRELRRMHLEARRGENAACGNCSNLTTLPDNIDARRLDILKRL